MGFMTFGKGKGKVSAWTTKRGDVKVKLGASKPARKASKPKASTKKRKSFW